MNPAIPKIIIGLVAAGLLLGLALTFSADPPLTAEYSNGFLKLRNISDEDVEIGRVIVNGRNDCTVVDLMPISRTLKVGDSKVFLSQCDVLRVTVATANDEMEFKFK